VNFNNFIGKERTMADKTSPTVSKTEVRHYVRLMSPKYPTVTRPLDDPAEVKDLDKAYDRYETFDRFFFTVDYDGDRHVVKSQPLNESGAQANPNHAS
jgi:hypothetical protein